MSDALHPTGIAPPDPDEGSDIHDLLRLPKAELHVHLDGSLRPATMLDLADERDVSLPRRTPDALATYMRVDDATNLVEYLARFAITLSVMQDAEAIERIAYELALDHASESVRYLEVRFCPALNTVRGMSAEGAVEAAVRGLQRAESEVDVRASVIVCALRSRAPSEAIEMAELAAAHLGRGVSGFDLAGAEDGHPVRDHAEAFNRAREGGVPITIHAGEGFGPASIREAIEVGHARRIGHGTRLGEDPTLLADVRTRRIPLEVCLTSNVQTRVSTSYATHPAQAYVRDGVAVTLSTDNRLMSGVTVADEYRHAHEHLRLGRAELVAIARAGFEHAFVAESERQGLLERFDRAVAGAADA